MIIAIALGLATRVVHTGLFVGPLGVRIRTMWRTSTYDWLHIDDFASIRNPERYPDLYPARTELVLRLANGTTVPTPIAIQRRGRNWRERRRFARV